MARRQLGTNDYWWPDGLLARNTAMVSSVRELRVLRSEFVTNGPKPDTGVHWFVTSINVNSLIVGTMSALTAKVDSPPWRDV